MVTFTFLINLRFIKICPFGRYFTFLKIRYPYSTNVTVTPNAGPVVSVLHVKLIKHVRRTAVIISASHNDAIVCRIFVIITAFM